MTQARNDAQYDQEVLKLLNQHNSELYNQLINTPEEISNFESRKKIFHEVRLDIYKAVYLSLIKKMYLNEDLRTDDEKILKKQVNLSVNYKLFKEELQKYKTVIEKQFFSLNYLIEISTNEDEDADKKHSGGAFYNISSQNLYKIFGSAEYYKTRGFITKIALEKIWEWVKEDFKKTHIQEKTNSDHQKVVTTNSVGQHPSSLFGGSEKILNMKEKEQKVLAFLNEIDERYKMQP